MFFLLIFAIAALQLWMGEMRNRCINISDGVMDENLICGDYECASIEKCASGLNNPNYGQINFDNIFYSLFAVFQCVTAEAWSEVMLSVQKAYSHYVFIYFIPLVYISTFLVLNLVLAVIKSAFIEAI